MPNGIAGPAMGLALDTLLELFHYLFGKLLLVLCGIDQVGVSSGDRRLGGFPRGWGLGREPDAEDVGGARVDLYVLLVILVLLIVDDHVIEVAGQVAEQESPLVVRPDLIDHNAPRLQGDLDAVGREAAPGDRDLAADGAIVLRGRGYAEEEQQRQGQSRKEQAGQSAASNHDAPSANESPKNGVRSPTGPQGTSARAA